MKKSTPARIGKVIEIDQGSIQDHMREMVRGTVEVTLDMPKLRAHTLETAIIERYKRVRPRWSASMRQRINGS